MEELTLCFVFTVLFFQIPCINSDKCEDKTFQNPTPGRVYDLRNQFDGLYTDCSLTFYFPGVVTIKINVKNISLPLVRRIEYDGINVGQVQKMTRGKFLLQSGHCHTNKKSHALSVTGKTQVTLNVTGYVCVAFYSPNGRDDSGPLFGNYGPRPLQIDLEVEILASECNRRDDAITEQRPGETKLSNCKTICTKNGYIYRDCLDPSIKIPRSTPQLVLSLTRPTTTSPTISGEMQTTTERSLFIFPSTKRLNNYTNTSVIHSDIKSTLTYKISTHFFTPSSQNESPVTKFSSTAKTTSKENKNKIAYVSNYLTTRSVPRTRESSMTEQTNSKWTNSPSSIMHETLKSSTDTVYSKTNSLSRTLTSGMATKTRTYGHVTKYKVSTVAQYSVATKHNTSILSSKFLTRNTFITTTVYNISDGTTSTSKTHTGDGNTETMTTVSTEKTLDNDLLIGLYITSGIAVFLLVVLLIFCLCTYTKRRSSRMGYLGNDMANLSFEGVPWPVCGQLRRNWIMKRRLQDIYSLQRSSNMTNIPLPHITHDPLLSSRQKDTLSRIQPCRSQTSERSHDFSQSPVQQDENIYDNIGSLPRRIRNDSCKSNIETQTDFIPNDGETELKSAINLGNNDIPNKKSNRSNHVVQDGIVKSRILTSNNLSTKQRLSSLYSKVDSKHTNATGSAISST